MWGDKLPSFGTVPTLTRLSPRYGRYGGLLRKGGAVRQTVGTRIFLLFWLWMLVKDARSIARVLYLPHITSTICQGTSLNITISSYRQAACSKTTVPYSTLLHPAWAQYLYSSTASTL